LRAEDVGLAMVPEQLNESLAIGWEVKWRLHDSPYAQHPSDDRLSGIYGTIVFDELPATADGSLHQRNVTIFADGEVDRSPCGSGSAARLTVLDARGELGPGRCWWTTRSSAPASPAGSSSGWLPMATRP
jgi:proline racemase